MKVQNLHVNLRNKEYPSTKKNNKRSSFSSGGETHGGQVVTSQSHLNLRGPRSPALRIESFRPAGDHTHTHTRTHMVHSPVSWS